MKLITIVALAVLAAGCRVVSEPPPMRLLAPKELSHEERVAVLQESLAEAVIEFTSPRPGEIPAEDSALLEGRDTRGFLYYKGRLHDEHADPRRLQLLVDHTGSAISHSRRDGSAFVRPELTDRYVIALLKRGYVWDEGEDAVAPRRK